MDKNFLAIIAASLAVCDEEIVSAHFAGLGQLTNEPPETIQLFPPGRHVICAHKAGQPVDLTLTITEETAKIVAASFAEMMAECAKGEGAKPYIDFNHDDKEASGWVESVFWAGNDPKTGGVRAKIAWSEPGARAITGKAYRQFSPRFLAPYGEITGVPTNMGGLVNRPAFTRIETLSAKGAQPSNTMNKLNQLLVGAALLSAIPTDETSAVLEFSKAWDGVQAKLAKLDATTEALVSAKDAIKKLTEERDAISAKAADISKSNAKTLVAGLVRDGKIAPKDTKTQEKWEAILAKDASSIDLLEGIITAKGAAGSDLTRTIVQASATTTDVPPINAKEAFDVKVKMVAERNKVPMNAAMPIAAREFNDEYKAYRAALTGIIA